MKSILTLLILALVVTGLQAQDTTAVKVMKKNVVTVTEEPNKTEVSLLNDHINVQDNYFSDTTTIRVGRRNIEIIEKDNRTYVNVIREEGDEYNHCWRKERKTFNGHWSGFEIGVNGFYDTDYGMYSDPGNDFMDLNQPNSLEVNINFVEYNIALVPHRLGIVSGLGLQYNNYKFDNPITIDKGDDGIIEWLPVDETNFKKSKLTVSYLTLPIMLEWQIPVNDRSNYFFVSGGMVGGLNLGSHTKIKTNNTKSKDKGSFNINPFKYSAIARIGLRDFSIYATYSLSSLFKDDKGPELFPFTIGICLVNF